MSTKDNFGYGWIVPPVYDDETSVNWDNYTMDAIECELHGMEVVL